MTEEDWIKLYNALKNGGSIGDVIYDDSRSLREQESVQLYLSRNLSITVKIIHPPKETK